MERVEKGTVRGFLHVPEKPSGDGLVFGHGAGGDCNTALIRAIAETFCDAGIAVLRVDLVFRQLGKTPTGAMQVRDREGLREAVEYLRGSAKKRVFLGGHSYGGRQASMLGSEDAKIAAALLLFSYPLHPPGQAAKMRTEHFPKLSLPCFFAHGTKDAFGSPEEMSAAIQAIPGKTELMIVEKGGHGLPATSVGAIAEKFRALAG